VAVSFLDTLYWQRTPQGQIPVTKDGRPLTPEEYDALEADWVGREQRIQSNTRQLAAEREQAAAQRAAQSQAEFNAGAGGVPWTATEMASGLSGAPGSDLALDPELTTPPRVDIGEVAADHGMVMVQNPARGREVVANDSGQRFNRPATGYSVAAPSPVFEDEADEYLPDVAPNAVARPDLERAGYRAMAMDTELTGPDGPPSDGPAQYVYRADPSAREAARRGENGRQMGENMSGGTEFQRRQRIKRMADKLGVSKAEVYAMLDEPKPGEGSNDPSKNAATPGRNSFAAFDPVRDAIDDKQRLEKAARARAAHDAIVRDAQRRQRPMEFLNNPTVSEDAKRQMQYQLAGQRGMTPNDITAAGELRYREGIMAGARQNLNVTDPALQRELLEQQRRKDDPSAAGAADLRSGKPMSPQAIDEIDRLAETMDTSPFGFGYDDERRLAVTLREQYGLSQAEAEAAANRAANKKRWIWSQTKPEDARGVPKPPPPASSDPGVRAWTSGRV